MCVGWKSIVIRQEMDIDDDNRLLQHCEFRSWIYIGLLAFRSARMKTGADILEEAAQTFREKNAIYGNNWRLVGKVMRGLFPNGLEIQSAEDWERLHILLLMVVKMTRYAVNFKNGHADSIRDATVYGAMLEMIDEEIEISSSDLEPDADFRIRIVQVSNELKSKSERLVVAAGKELDAAGEEFGLKRLRTKR